MGRASRVDAAKHREDVVNAMARLLRERGPAGVSVQDLMLAVGLTHGGFYKHFSSKDELVGIATEAAFDEIRAALTRIGEDEPDRTRARSEVIRTYLSAEHRDAPGTGCANTALAGDAARSPADSPLRGSYVAGLEDTLEQLAKLEHAPSHGSEEPYRRAVADLATMVGALTLARATSRTPLSDQILQIVREALDPGR
ncbi:TetR/AcrR family transcriptional regulator [Plantactinospora solaniradicis]|uniref:TetR/AcrR family transcriptional regulator n=1 Tax=Plantactinospora solaniradicis TaxID=1723736 RepID=A0ABW1KBE7_9ACTN